MECEVTNVPPVVDAEFAVVCFYTKNQITLADMQRLFGMSKSFCCELAKRTKTVFQAKGIPIWFRGALSTIGAFEAWGIDAKALERGVKRVKELGLR